jgi:hypothetical protein
MSAIQPRYSKEEFARRGDNLYETVVRPAVESEHSGKFVAIDIESGSYELGDDEIAASEKLEARVPDAQIWIARVGSRHVRRFGSRTDQASS